MALQEARDLAAPEFHSMFGLRQRRPRAAVTTEFGQALAAFGIKHRSAARWFRTSERNVRRWKDGTRKTPPSVAVVVQLILAGKVTVADVELAASLIPTRTNGAKGEPSVRPRDEPALASVLANPGQTVAEKVYALAGCRYPYGDLEHPEEFYFCGAPIARGFYCQRHLNLVYLPPRTSSGHGARIGFVAHKRQPRPQQAPAHDSPSTPSAFFATGAARPPAELAGGLPR